WLESGLRKYFFGRLLTDYGKLARWARWLRLVQRSGLQKLARTTGILKLLGLADLEALAPAMEDKFFFEEFGQTFPAIGRPRPRITFLGGCIASVAAAELNHAPLLA